MADFRPPHSGIVLRRLDLDIHAHLARGAGDDLHRGWHVAGVQVGHLALGDFLDLFLRELADLDIVLLFRSSVEFERLCNHRAGRRLVGDAYESLVLVYGDVDR